MWYHTRPEDRSALRVFAFTGLLAALLVAVLFPILPSRLKVGEGDIAAHTVRAPREVHYESQVLREQLQEQRKASVRQVVAYDVNVQSQQLAKLTEIVARITGQRDTPGFPRAARDEGIARIQGVNLSAAQRATILDFTPEQWARTVDEAFRVLRAVLEEPFSAAELEDRKAAARNRVRDGFPALEGDIVVALVQPLVVPTQRVDEAETQKARERAASSVEPQVQTYAKGQVIVREGEVIDRAKIEALQAAGLLNVRLSTHEIAGVVVVALLAAGALGLYLSTFPTPTLASMRRLLVVALLVAGLVLTAKLYLPLVLPDNDRRFLALVLPVAAVPMLVAALFEAPFAIVVAVVSTVLATFTAQYLPDISGIVGLASVQPLQMTAAYLFGGVAGVLVVQRAERLSRFFLAGTAVSVASFLGLISFWFLDDSRRPVDLAWMAAASVLAGGLTSVLTVGLFALLGSVFGITTRLQLMELAQLNAPLLRRLQDEAPGTFHHSILVGNLAERAADLIGADSLLARVGSYYHDIGKLGRPGYFIENQLAGGNPHADLDPATSSQILQDHVRHGLELARRHRLPDRVRAFIQEHHGTLRTAYFYRLAAQVDPDVDPALFTYTGPRPRSRETAIVMLADSTEAAVRAARDPSPERIEAVVEQVIAERLADGQFDECDLTLRDLRVIADSFKRSLRAIYHPRVEYPAPAPAEEARRRTAALPPASQGRLTLVGGSGVLAPRIGTHRTLNGAAPAAEEPAEEPAPAVPPAPAGDADAGAAAEAPVARPAMGS
jgi:putative nucleotidyltransferase with HDIG domain